MAEQFEKKQAEPRQITRLIRLPEVMRRVGLGRSTIYRWMNQGKFPRPVRMGGHVVAWVEDEVEAWISRKLF